jgi:hypothetical protein
MGRKVAASPPDAGTTFVIPLRNETPRNLDLPPIRESYNDLKRCRNNLEELPDEILLQIATHLKGSGAVTNLSLVNKKIHAVANEAMARNLVIRESNFKEAIVWLARHLHLINSVKSVEIIGRGYVEAAGYLSLDEIPFAPSDLLFSPHVETTLRELIYKQHDGKVTWEHIHNYGRLTGNAAFETQFCTDLLFKICPNIKTAKAQLRGPEYFDWMDTNPIQASMSDLPMVNSDCELNTPFYDTALQVLQNSLESLTIAQNRQWAGPVQRELLISSVHVSNSRLGRPPMTLRGFKKLRHLDVPMEILGLPDSIYFAPPGESRIEWVDVSGRVAQQGPSTKALTCPAKIIPLTIETLQLRSCDGATFMLLDIISHIPAGTSNFKYIDVFFTTCTREFIHLCRQADNDPLDYFEIISQLVGLGIEVSFYKGKSETIVDMWRELDVLDGLSLEEICMAAVARRQFFEYNELALNRRRTNRVDNVFFMKHALAHFDLLNSSTLDVDKWENIALFRGKKYIKPEPKLEPQAGRFEVAARPKGIHALPKRQPTGFLDLDSFSFTFRHITPLPAATAYSSEGHTSIWFRPIPVETQQQTGTKLLADRLCSTTSPMTHLTKDAFAKKVSELKTEVLAHLFKLPKKSVPRKKRRALLPRIVHFPRSESLDM